jgi:hypothetical protein
MKRVALVLVALSLVGGVAAPMASADVAQARSSWG